MFTSSRHANRYLVWRTVVILLLVVIMVLLAVGLHQSNPQQPDYDGEYDVFYLSLHQDSQYLLSYITSNSGLCIAGLLKWQGEQVVVLTDKGRITLFANSMVTIGDYCGVVLTSTKGNRAKVTVYWRTDTAEDEPPTTTTTLQIY
jgi:hypothetical protein